MFALYATAAVVVQAGASLLEELVNEVEELLEVKKAAQNRADTCVMKYSVPKCGKCMESVQCELADVTATSGPMKGFQSAYCCPRLKVCLQGPRDGCPQPVAQCDPKCFDKTGQGCTCQHADFPDNWAGQTCPSGYVPPIYTSEPETTEVLPTERPTSPPVRSAPSKKPTSPPFSIPSDAVLCPNQPAQNYCDCQQDGDCTDSSVDFCSCADAKVCCAQASGNGDKCASKAAADCVDSCSFCMTCQSNPREECDKCMTGLCRSCGPKYAECFPIPDLSNGDADCSSKEAATCVGNCGTCLDSAQCPDFTVCPRCLTETCACMEEYAKCAAPASGDGYASGHGDVYAPGMGDGYASGNGDVYASGNGEGYASGDKCDSKAAAECVDTCSFCLTCQDSECDACMDEPCGSCGKMYRDCFPVPDLSDMPMPGADCSSAEAGQCVKNCGTCVDSALCPDVEKDCPRCMTESCSCLNDFVKCAFAAM